MKLSTAIAMTMVSGALAVVSAPAFADIDDCPSARTCLWEDNDYKGGRYGRESGDSTIVNLPAYINNDTDSFANTSGTFQSCAWSGSNGTGDRQDWEEYEQNSNLSPLNSDEISSLRTKFGC